MVVNVLGSSESSLLEYSLSQLLTELPSGIVGSGVSWGTSWTWAGGPYQVKSYATAGRLVEPPRLISSISSLPSTFIFTNTVSSGTVSNVAYDLFTSANANAETWAGDYELMIW